MHSSPNIICSENLTSENNTGSCQLFFSSFTSLFLPYYLSGCSQTSHPSCNNFLSTASAFPAFSHTYLFGLVPCLFYIDAHPFHTSPRLSFIHTCLFHFSLRLSSMRPHPFHLALRLTSIHTCPFHLAPRLSSIRTRLFRLSPFLFNLNTPLFNNDTCLYNPSPFQSLFQSLPINNNSIITNPLN